MDDAGQVKVPFAGLRCMRALGDAMSKASVQGSSEASAPPLSRIRSGADASGEPAPPTGRHSQGAFHAPGVVRAGHNVALEPVAWFQQRLVRGAHPTGPALRRTWAIFRGGIIRRVRSTHQPAFGPGTTLRLSTLPGFSRSWCAERTPRVAAPCSSALISAARYPTKRSVIGWRSSRWNLTATLPSLSQDA